MSTHKTSSKNQKTQFSDWEALRQSLAGEFFTDDTLLTLYSTDASAYKEKPLAVALPKNKEDIKQLILFSNKEKLPLIPRTAGTSLAGQVVGKGIIVDMSKYFTKIVELNENEKWVKVQPGVIRDELNLYLKPHQLYFGPETSTANRAMMGGMVGNNSCGANSIVYGSTRDQLLSVEGFLSDGSFVRFEGMDKDSFFEKINRDDDALETKIYKETYALLNDKETQKNIIDTFPKPNIKRRNTGYAVDLLLNNSVFDVKNSGQNSGNKNSNNENFNFCQLIAGSEGTLMFITEIKLALSPILNEKRGLLCVHFNDLYEALKSNVVALDFNPYAVELIDHYVLSCTKSNAEQQKNRFFVKGEPAALLIIDLSGKDEADLLNKKDKLIKSYQSKNLGYHYPFITGEEQNKVWSLRKAGLGLLANISKEAKAVPVIEDTAVAVEDLHDYIKDFNEILEKYKLSCVHYAHAGSGELHLRPILDLKTQEGNDLFYIIAKEIAQLVKKYKGSLSGEHGDGRLRGEFIPFMIGDENYNLLKKIKQLWDPHHLFNPNKIIDTPSMRSNHRFPIGYRQPKIDTIFSYKKNGGYVNTTELCNGSGDCRKLLFSGGIMCPSYRATKNEKETTRARANVLREVLSLNENQLENPFTDERIADVLELCLSCKGCKVECPSNVDMTKLKSEALFQKYKTTGVPFRVQLIGYYMKAYSMGAKMPRIFNFFIKNKFSSSLMKSLAGFAPQRQLPLVSNPTVTDYIKKNQKKPKQLNISENTVQNAQKNQNLNQNQNRVVYIFCDEFTNYNDAKIGIITWELLSALGYNIKLAPIGESGRTYFSKGLLDKAKKCAVGNVKKMSAIMQSNDILVGIEPSAILSFRDEYIDIVDDDLKEIAKTLAKQSFLIEEFIVKEFEQKSIQTEQFSKEKKSILLHTHCHQKTLSSISFSKQFLSIPQNFTVTPIPSSCCGMAGSFGYDKKHYELSMQIGEISLFPSIRESTENTTIVATGTSCRHQIWDGTQRKALHPVEVLYEALEKE